MTTGDIMFWLCPRLWGMPIGKVSLVLSPSLATLTRYRAGQLFYLETLSTIAETGRYTFFFLLVASQCSGRGRSTSQRSVLKL